jgi:hypothetical protein
LFQNFTLPPDSQPFLGLYNSSIPTLKLMEIKAQSSHLSLAVNRFDAFFLNYTAPLTFKIVINPVMDCMNAYIMGVENDVVVFDEPTPSDGRCQRFIMYGASVDGLSHFNRIN